MSDASPGTLPHGRALWLAEARALLALGLPVVATQLAQMAMVSTDLMMVGHLGQEPLAAAALGAVLYFSLWLIGSGPAFAVSPVVAHILGAEPENVVNVRSAMRMAFWIVLLLSGPIYALSFVAEPVLLLTGQDPKLAAAAASYIVVLALSLPFVFAFMVLRNFVTALNRPLIPMFILAAMVALNLLGNYVFIFGHFGMPALGLVGSGVSTALVNACGFLAILVVVLLRRPFRSYRLFANFLSPDWPHFKELSRLGASICAAMMVEITLFNVASLMVGRFGSSALAAHQIAINVCSISFMVPLGIGIAATIRVGTAAGAKDADGVRRTGLTALVLGAVIMSVFGIIFALFPRQIAALYLADSADSEGAIVLAAVYLRIAAAFQLFDGIQVIGINALRGLKDAYIPMWLAAISYWLVGFPLALLLGFYVGLEGFGIWIGLAISLAAAATLMVFRFLIVSRKLLTASVTAAE